MLPPGSRFKHNWDYFMLVLVLYNCVLTPMQFGFYNSPVIIQSAITLIAVDVLIWLLFCGAPRSPAHRPRPCTLLRP